MKINLNHEVFLSIAKFPCGTSTIEIKIGRKTYMLDITKDSNCTHIDLYDKKHSNRNSYSKYGSNLHYVCVKNNAFLNREFFENIEEIEKIPALLRKFGDKLEIF